MRTTFRFALLLIPILFFQCQKEVSYIGSGDAGVASPEPLTANLQGNVLDENGQAAEAVVITAGSKTATTDNKGYFRILSASLDKTAALVTAEKSGYFSAYRVFSATSGTNQIVIKLVKKKLAGTIDAATGGEVSLTNGAKVSLPPGGVVRASTNADYPGTVNVYTAYIDPTAPDIRETVPGSFLATDKDGKRVLLSSFGMMAVELESTSGEKLQVKSGAVATLTTPIPSSAGAAAPATIPLWYVDPSTGLWKEEGSAAKQGNNYVGTVKHFTYWNCDIPVERVQFTATIENADGKPLVHASVVIKPTSGNYYGTAHGFSDTLGQVSGPIPANMNLVLQVIDPCGGVIYSQNIGPYTENVNLDTITIPSSTAAVVTIKGKLLTCNGTNVVKGYAIVNIDNRVHYAAVDAGGNFSTNYLLCNSNVTAHIIGVDETAQQQGTAASVTIVPPTTDAGSIVSCGTSAAQFINYNLDGTDYSIAATDSLTAFTDGQNTSQRITYINGLKIGSNDYISFKFSHATNTAGVYAMTNIDVHHLGNLTLVQPFNVTISNFPQAPGEFYEGSFTGQFRDSTNNMHTITCTFRIRRTF